MAKRRALEVIFGMDSDGFSAGMRKVSNETRKYESKQKRSNSVTQKAGSSMASAAKAAVALAAAYVSVEQAKKAVETTEELSLASKGLTRNLGLATKQASRWAVVTRARGVDSKAMVMAFTTLSKRIEATKDGTESALKPFKALGITQKELAATGGNFTKQVNLIAKAMGDAEGSATRQAAASQLLGRGYQSLLPMFSDGAKGLREQLRWADEFGATLDEKTIGTMEDFTTAQRKSKVATMGLQIAFAKYATPAFTAAHDAYQDFVRLVNNDKLTGEQKIKRLKATFDKYADMILKVVTDLMPQIAQRAGQAGVEIAKGLAKGFMETGLLGKVAIGVWVMRSFGGVAAISAAGKAWGTIFGRSAAAASATQMSTTTAAGGLFGGGAKGALKTGAAVAALYGGLEIANGAFNKSTGSVMQRLEEIDNRGKGMLGTISRAFGGGSGGVLEWANQGGLSQQGDIAHDLLKSVKEIATADRGRFQVLKETIAAKAEELDLTAKQRRELEGIVRASKVGKQIAGQQRIDAGAARIRSGAFVGADLQAATDKQLKAVSSLYGRYTPQWRAAVWQTLKAQEFAVRKAWTKNGRLTREGIERIKQIQERRKNLLAGADPIGIGKGIANSWKRARTATQVNMGRMVKQLKELPPKAREQAAQTMLKYARELESKGKIPEGTVKRLKSKVLLNFGPSLWKNMQQNTRQGFAGVTASFTIGTRSAEKQMAGLTSATRRHARNVKSAVSSINAPVRAAYSNLAQDTNTALSAFGAKDKVSVAFRRGGRTPFRGKGLVPSMVSPGERVDYRGKSWIVPGKRVAADNVYAELPSGAQVFTEDGQNRLAAGESRYQTLKKQMPHFSGGGQVGRPVLSGGNKYATETGQSGIDRVRKWAVKWVKDHSATDTGAVRMYRGVRMADWVIGALQYAAGKGASPQPTSGYRTHAENVAQGRYYISEHEKTKYPGGAVDFGGFTSGYSAKMSVVRATSDYPYPLLAPIGFRDDGHASGTGHRKGGVIGRYRGGGTVRAITDALLRRGYSPMAAAGIVGNAYRESRWNPASVGTGGGGLFGFTTSPISLADLQAAAARKGVSWTDIDFQVGFMDAHMPSSLKAQLNSAGSVYDTTKLFMDEWERPGVKAFDDRLAGARVAMRQLNKRRSKKVSRAKAAVASVKKLWANIKQSGTTKAGYKRARLAGKNAKKALGAARGYDFDGATSRMARFRKFRRKSYRDLRRFRRRSGTDGKGGGLGPSKSSGGFGWAAGLPEWAQSLIETPGLSWQQRRDIVDTALSVAQGTGSSADDIAANRAVISMERARKRGALKRFRRLSAKFRRLGGNARIKRLRSLLAGKGLSKEQRKKYRQELNRLTGAKSGRDDALTAVNEATSQISSAKQSIKDAKDQSASESSSDLVSAIKDLNDTIAEQNRIQSSVQATSGREAIRMLADVLGGEMVGKGAFNQFAGVRY